MKIKRSYLKKRNEEQGELSGAAARTGKEDEEKNKKQEKIREQEELLKVEDKKGNHEIYNVIIGGTHGGKIIGSFPY